MKRNRYFYFYLTFNACRDQATAPELSGREEKRDQKNERTLSTHNGALSMRTSGGKRGETRQVLTFSRIQYQILGDHNAPNTMAYEANIIRMRQTYHADDAKNVVIASKRSECWPEKRRQERGICTLRICARHS